MAVSELDRRRKMVVSSLSSKLKASPAGRTVLRAGKAAWTLANTAALRLYLANEARKGPGTERPSTSRLRTATVSHIFYPELLDEILACHARLPEGAVCHLTAPPKAAEALRPRIEALDNVRLTVVENRGRDIAPFLTVLQSGALDGLDAVLKIHGKRSTHLSQGNLLRRAMLTSIAGRTETVERVLRIMEDPKVGMVGWRQVFLTAPRHWHTNRDLVEQVLNKLEPRPPVRLAFFGGSMFWFRPAALESITRAPVATEDFDAEAGQIDGTLHHAFERCFALAAVASGFSVTDTAGRVLLEPDGLRLQRS